jgi:hypothetical protein
MVLVRLVGEDAVGCRVLIQRENINVESIQDVERAFECKGWGLTGTTGYVLHQESITAEINPEDSVGSKVITKELTDNLWVLYKVHRRNECSEEMVRQMVDGCLRDGSSVNAVESHLKRGGVVVGHTKIERYWHEALVIRDLLFLKDSREARERHALYLLHDLCPMTQDMSDSRKLGHMTIAYRGSDGMRKTHTIAVYVELTSAGAAQERCLDRALEYLEHLRLMSGDDVEIDPSS